MGPGRQYEYGDLHLTELSAAVAPGDDRVEEPGRSCLRRPSRPMFGQRDPFASPPGAIGRNRVTRWGWDIRGQIGLRNAIAFATAAPVDAPAGSTWIIRLDCQDARWKHGTLGRFRLSVTNGPVTLFETSLHKALTEPEWNGRTRLGVVYYLQEDWQAAAEALRIAADAPGGHRHRPLPAGAGSPSPRPARRGPSLSRRAGIDWLEQNKNSGTLRTAGRGGDRRDRGDQPHPGRSPDVPRPDIPGGPVRR